MQFTALFSPLKVNTMELKNCFVIPAMGTLYADTDGMSTQKLVDYWGTRAKGGYGLLVVEAAAVDPIGKAISQQLGLWDDKFIPGLKRIVDEVHCHDTKIAIQLQHAGRQTSSDTINGKQPVAPSAIPCTVVKTMPHELSTTEVYEIIEKFGDAARRAQVAGFDAIEVHGGHGYLVSQFMSAYFNKRVDEFGGTFEDRMKFPVELIKNIREKVGKDFPIMFRLSCEELVPGGRTIDESRAVARVLEDTGVDLLDASVAVYHSMPFNVAPSAVAPGYNISVAAELKKSVRIPVIAVCRINSPVMAEDILQTGKADLVAFGRASLADPEMPNKVADGALEDIAPCCGCMQGCIGRVYAGKYISCTINPFTGREGVLKLEPTLKSKKVIVVGGGPAGLEAAWIAAKRGHCVTLYEKENMFGGQFRIAAIPPFKQEITGQIKYLVRMCRKYNVRLKLNTDFIVDAIEQENPDVVILATGGVPQVPSIKNLDQIEFIKATDVLEGKVQTGDKVLIVGGGLVASETADYLGEHGHKVTMIMRRPEIAVDVEPAVKYFLLQRINEYGVQIFTGCTFNEFLHDGVIFEKDGKTEELHGFDSIVLALGVKPFSPLEEKLQGKVSELYVIGDAAEAQKAIDAIEQAARLAVTL